MSTLIAGIKAEPVLTLSRFWATVSTRTGAVTAILMALALVYWLWYGLTQRSITGDDGISILAAQGILEHGYTRLPSGYIYYRGFVPHYLLAGSIAAFGLNDFAIMLPSLLMALGSLGLTYLFARDVLGRPLVGVASVALLLVLDVQTFYATSPRMYMSLQFFTILSAYSAWRGYIKGEGHFQWLAVLALAGAFLSHQQGGVLLVAIPLAVIAIRWLQGKERPRINYPLALTSYAVLWVVFVFLFVYPLPNDIPQIASHSGVDPGFVGLNTDLFLWAKHVGWLERTVPFGIILAPLLAALSYQAFKNRHTEEGQGTLYACGVFLIAALGVASIVQTSQVRFWLFLVPVYVPLLLLSVFALGRWLKEARSDHQAPLWRRPSVLVAGLVGWGIVVFLIANFAYFRLAYVDVVKNAYGLPCASPYTGCSKVVKGQYNAVRPAIQEGDVVVSSNPWVTSYYLGRVDAYIREMDVDGTFVPFDSPTDEYFGISFIDSPKKLVELRDSDQRAWVFADYKVRLYLGEETRNALSERYVKYDEGIVMTIYVNR